MTGCQILDGTPIGLLLEGCQDTLVSSCTVIDQRELKKTTSGVVWRHSGPGNMLVQSRISGGTGSDVVADDAVTQSGNLIV